MCYLHYAFDTSDYEDRARVNGRLKRYSFSDATVPFVVDMYRVWRNFELLLHRLCDVQECCERFYQ